MSPRKLLKKEAGKTRKGRRQRRKLDSAWKEVIKVLFKLAAAKELMRECYMEGYSKDVVHTLVQFLVWVIRSSKKYERQLKEEIKKIEEERNMPYVIPWERTAEKRGRRKGMEKKAKDTAKNLLAMGIDIDKIVKATGLKKEAVETLASAYH